MCVHYPTLTEANFTTVPSIVCLEEDMLLLLMPMAFSRRFRTSNKEYFMYKVGSGSEEPSLLRIPTPTHHPRYNRPQDIAMFRWGDGGQFYLAALLFT
ncbi:hypothetical protein E2562_009502 [Oryza meyeriana var. granulata]|uniref:Uncharacterized protein n=1 Tax=Oryza meyeriana var. granulata TaxID=110450 RepID=A0A6G1BU41_9ORYZ|nr:hypothetical protein E2562_009502 [Oryza meyeriana var. granulata]